MHTVFPAVKAVESQIDHFVFISVTQGIKLAPSVEDLSDKLGTKIMVR